MGSQPEALFKRLDQEREGVLSLMQFTNWLCRVYDWPAHGKSEAPIRAGVMNLRRMLADAYRFVAC